MKTSCDCNARPPRTRFQRRGSQSRSAFAETLSHRIPDDSCFQTFPTKFHTNFPDGTGFFYSTFLPGCDNYSSFYLQELIRPRVKNRGLIIPHWRELASWTSPRQSTKARQADLASVPELGPRLGTKKAWPGQPRPSRKSTENLKVCAIDRRMAVHRWAHDVAVCDRGSRSIFDRTSPGIIMSQN